MLVIGMISRPALIRRLMGSPHAAVTLLTAPAGCGKTSLLAEWAEADPRRFAWVKITPADDDPLHLLRSIAAAVGVAETPERRGTKALSRQLAELVRDSRDEFVLVLDDAQFVQSRDAAAELRHLIDGLGPNACVALATRVAPSLPVARLRAERRLIELHTRDLCLTRDEVVQVAAAHGLDLDDRGAELLARRTEGWPAGVSLAALAVAGDPQPLRALARFGGDDQAVADYLREEVLAPLPAHVREFMVRSSILERLSGPLCDHVLERRDSLAVLRGLERRNLVLPLDRTRTQYRFQSLLAQTLRSELASADGMRRERLHQRASEWYQSRDDQASALDHAVCANDLERAGALVWNETAPLLSYGDNATLLARLGRFSAEEMATSPALATSCAMTHLAMGERALAEHWTAVATRTMSGVDGLDPSLEVAGYLLRAAAGDDTASAAQDAARASELAEADSPWRTLACLIPGLAKQLSGEPDAARALLDEGSRSGAATAPSIQVLCQAQLAVMAMSENDWESATMYAVRAHAQTDRVGLGEYPTSALVYAASAAAHAHSGRLAECERDTRQATRLLAKLADFTPWYKAECSIALAWAGLRVGDLPAAQALLKDAERELRMIPDATTAREWLSACSVQTALVASARNSEAHPLTTAELRVLQFLPTHLSFPEIALELFVSTNTVKTHARAVYRKLAASCRNEAVTNARETGLLANVA